MSEPTLESDRRTRQAHQSPEGYPSGPDAPIGATAAALADAQSAVAVVLVEGISDQVAVETLARRQGRDLPTEGVVVVPMGGAHAVVRHLLRFGPHGAGLVMAGICDAAEAEVFRLGLKKSGLGDAETWTDMERLGFFVCVEDLEDELIRACGQESIEDLLADHGDLTRFRTLQRQPAWRQGSFDAQMRRFLGAGSRRKLRYAALLVDSLPLDKMPKPLREVLNRTRLLDS